MTLLVGGGGYIRICNTPPQADLPEFTTNGLLQDLINLAKEWNAPNYVIIVDSHISSTSSIHMVGPDAQRS